MYKISIIVCIVLLVIFVGVSMWESNKGGQPRGKIAGEKPLGEPVFKSRGQPVKIISKAEAKDAIGNEKIEFYDDEDNSIIIANPPTQDDYPTLDGEINVLRELEADVEIRVGEEEDEYGTLLEDSTGVFDLEVVGIAGAEWANYVPITQIIIEDDNGEEICVLDWSTGKLEFRGKMSSSARSFFKYFLKPHVDEYIAGLSYEDALELKWKFPLVGCTFVFRNMTWPLTQSLSIDKFIEWLYENDYEIVKKK